MIFFCSNLVAMLLTMVWWVGGVKEWADGWVEECPLTDSVIVHIVYINETNP